MKFVCDRCQTKYSIADDKVRGKVLKVRCKTCQNVITVREAGAKPSVGSLAPVRPSQRPSSGPLATLEDDSSNQERTSIAPAPAGLMADLVANQRRATPPPPPPLGDGIEWFLALDGAQQGPFTRKVLVDRLLALPKNADVHVWNDQMDGWKPPHDVPDVAHDLAARKPPAVPVRPPVPRTTPSPPVPPLAARRGTQPLASGVGSKLPLPAPHVAAAHAVPAPHVEEAAPTPPPHGAIPAATNGAAKSNGLAAHAASPAAALPNGGSDALSVLDMGVGAPAKVPPRLMEVGDATSWSGAGRVQEGRHRNTKMILGLLGVVSVIIVVAAVNMTKKAPAAATNSTAKGGLDPEAFAKLADQVAVAEVTVQTTPKVEEPPPVEPPKGGKRQRGPVKGRGLLARGPAGATQPPGLAPSPGGGEAPSPPPPPSGGGMTERSIKPLNPVANRPPPSQAEITGVIAKNKIGIKTCYQRALLRDSSLTHGKIVVGVSIGLSGRVKSVRVDGPSSFRSLEPCIKEMVYRWSFPPASDEYGTEFSYLFQGNE
jgi:predicted Zn finger-like uncharacterized protein